MKIRKATLEDLVPLSELFDLYRIFYKKEPDINGVRSFLSERIKMGDSEIYVCLNIDNKLVGFVQLYPLFSSTKMKRLWLLNDLFVLETFRGHGISKLLIEQAKELAKQTNACGLLLETAKTNTVGNQLYPAMGFELEKESNFYYWYNY